MPINFLQSLRTSTLSHRCRMRQKSDVTDLFAAGWTKDQFDGLIAEAQRIGPERGVIYCLTLRPFQRGLSGGVTLPSRHGALGVAHIRYRCGLLHAILADYESSAPLRKEPLARGARDRGESTLLNRAHERSGPCSQDSNRSQHLAT